MLRAILTVATGIAALAMGLGGWLRRAASLSERALATTGGLLLFSATILTQPIGAVMFVTAVAVLSQEDTGDEELAKLKEMGLLFPNGQIEVFFNGIEDMNIP